METKIELGEATILIAIDQADTMTRTTNALKDYIKTHFPGTYTFTMIGHPKTLSRILPELAFHDTDDINIRTSSLSFVNDGGVEIVVRVVSYSNFKVGHLHLKTLENKRFHEYAATNFSIYDYSEYRDNEFTKIVKSINLKSFNPTAKEEFVETIKKIIRVYNLEEEDVGLMIVGPLVELTKIFPDTEFISVQKLSFKFLITIIEGIRTQCIAPYEDDGRPVRIIFFKRQDV